MRAFAARLCLLGLLVAVPATATDYVRGCQDRGAMVGGDSEGRKKSPEDVKTFLKKVFALTP